MKNSITKFDVVTVGGATSDILFYSKDGELISTKNATKEKLLAFEFGAKIYADKIYFDYGGGAANAAVTFARMGLKTSILCRVGIDDNGKNILQNFKQNNVGVDFIKVDKNNNTGFSIILTAKNDSKEHIAFLHRGANDLFSVGDMPLSKISTDWFYVGSLPKENWKQIIENLIPLNKNIVWNPGIKQLQDLSAVKKYLPHIRLLLVNRDEAMEFRKLKEIKGLMAYIQSLGVGIVAITDGKNGAYAFDGKKYYFIKAKLVKTINTIGVGDAFGSALTSGLIYGKNIKDSLKWGVSNSAAVVGKMGAQKGILKLGQIKR